MTQSRKNCPEVRVSVHKLGVGGGGVKWGRGDKCLVDFLMDFLNNAGSCINHVILFEGWYILCKEKFIPSHKFGNALHTPMLNAA